MQLPSESCTEPEPTNTCREKKTTIPTLGSPRQLLCRPCFTSGLVPSLPPLDFFPSTRRGTRLELELLISASTSIKTHLPLFDINQSTCAIHRVPVAVLGHLFCLQAKHLNLHLIWDGGLWTGLICTRDPPDPLDPRGSSLQPRLAGLLRPVYPLACATGL